LDKQWLHVDGNFLNANLAAMLLVNKTILVTLCIAIQAQIQTLYGCLEGPLKFVFFKFHFVSDTELGMLPHVKRALVCKDDVVKCFCVHRTSKRAISV